MLERLIPGADEASWTLIGLKSMTRLREKSYSNHEAGFSEGFFRGTSMIREEESEESSQFKRDSPCCRNDSIGHLPDDRYILYYDCTRGTNGWYRII